MGMNVSSWSGVPGPRFNRSPIVTKNAVQAIGDPADGDVAGEDEPGTKHTFVSEAPEERTVSDRQTGLLAGRLLLEHAEAGGDSPVPCSAKKASLIVPRDKERTLAAVRGGIPPALNFMVEHPELQRKNRPSDREVVETVMEETSRRIERLQVQAKRLTQQSSKFQYHHKVNLRERDAQDLEAVNFETVSTNVEMGAGAVEEGAKLLDAGSIISESYELEDPSRSEELSDSVSGVTEVSLTLEVVSTAIGGVTTFRLSKEAHYVKGLIRKKTKELISGKGKLSSKELKVLNSEIKELKQRRSELIRSASATAIRTSLSGSRTTLKVLKVAGAGTKLMGFFSTVFGGALSIFSLGTSSYSIHQARKKQKQIRSTLRTINHLAVLEHRENNQNLKSIYQDMRFFRSRNLEKQREATRVSVIKNSVSVGTSILGIASTVLTLLAKVGIVLGVAGATALSATGIGFVIGVGLALSIGVGYYAYKHRHSIINCIRQLPTKAVAWFKNDESTLLNLKEKAETISYREQFDVAYSARRDSLRRVQSDVSRARAIMNHSIKRFGITDKNNEMVKRVKHFERMISSISNELREVSEYNLKSFEKKLLVAVYSKEECKQLREVAVKCLGFKVEELKDDPKAFAKQIFTAMTSELG